MIDLVVRRRASRHVGVGCIGLPHSQHRTSNSLPESGCGRLSERVQTISSHLDGPRPVLVGIHLSRLINNLVVSGAGEAWCRRLTYFPARPSSGSPLDESFIRPRRVRPMCNGVSLTSHSVSIRYGPFRNS